MTSLSPIAAAWMIGFSALASFGLQSVFQSDHAAGVTPPSVVKSTQPPLTAPRTKTAQDNLQRLTEIAARVASMMRVEETPTSRVWPDIDTEPDGRCGLFLACSRPLHFSQEGERVLDCQSWLMLALLAVVKYADGHPARLDYIAFTDPEGLQAEQRWYFSLEMKAAAKLQHELLAGRLTMREVYDQIVSQWRLVTQAP